MAGFVPGVGGMGGAALACLARAGVGHFIIADKDEFEISNLNRQMFSSLDVIGREKTAVTKRMLKKSTWNSRWRFVLKAGSMN